MDQSLAEYLRTKLEEGGRATADEIISIVIAWYHDHGVAVEVRSRGIFKEDN
jgi:hypothetical protein